MVKCCDCIIVLFVHVGRVKDGVPSGGCLVNDVIFHAANNELPFGGKGASGMGSYHGSASSAM